MEIRSRYNSIDISKVCSSKVIACSKIPVLWGITIKIRGIKWTQNPVKALGIFFGHNKEECQKLNWEKKIEEMNPNISISFMAKAILVLELTNNVVSSANWDILIMCALSSIFTFIPLIFLFSLSLNAIIKLNWEKKIEEMKNQFTAWGKRNLTIMGKILIIKTLILPKFTFLAIFLV
jgi:hypothetical protein